MIFEWDDKKSARNEALRGFGFDFAIQIFLGPTLQYPDTRRNYGEARTNAIGVIDGNVYKVCFTDRPTGRRIISAHIASRKERRAWHVCLLSNSGLTSPI